MFGVSSMTTTLRRVAVRSPGPSLLNADAGLWHYGKVFDPARVAEEHCNFVSLLEKSDIEVVSISNPDNGIADAVFTYDASLVTPEGAVLMSPGKVLRQREQDVHRAFYQEQGIPVIGEVTGAARAEAGDTLWLDDKTIVIGRGFRTNEEGFSQLREIFAKQDIQVHGYDMPYYLGQAACLHLMSLISLVDTKTALVCTPLVPVGLYELLQKLGFTVLEAPFDEFEQTGTLSTNVLALAPGHCVMLDDIPKTRAVLENAGVKVEVFSGNSLCIGCEGGPTCLTRPLLRQ